MSTLQAFGIDLIVWIQGWSPALDSLMEFLTFFGKVEFYMIFIPLLYWTINKRWGFRVFMLLLFTDFVGVSFKLFLHQPRPFWISDEVKLIGSQEASYGIISTHASNPPAILGYLWLQVRKRWLLITAVVATLLISFSRIYLGVHFPHDIIAGWVSGLVMLYLFVKVEDRVSAGLRDRSTGFNLGAAFAVSMIFVVVAILISAAIAGSPDASNYAAYSEEARSLNHFFTLSGAVFGAMAGWILGKKSGQFSVGGPIMQKAARYLLGMAGVVVVLYGLDFAFDQVDAGQAVAFTLRYIRYGLTTFWVIFAAPRVFLKMKLAAPEND